MKAVYEKVVMMTLSRRFFFFAVVAITCSSAALAETKMAGSLAAENPCVLRPLSEQRGEACPEVIIPIGGTVKITSASGTTKRVRVNDKGIFATRLNPGDYTIEISKASISGNPIDSQDLRLSQRKLQVGTTSFRVRFNVAHKDHFPHTLEVGGAQ